jgi:replicative DNA helicase
MSAQELLERLACGNAGIDSKKLERNKLAGQERYLFQKSANELVNLPLWIDDHTSCTLPAIHATLRKHMQQHEVKLLIVDYLQLIQPVGNRENRTQQVSELSRGMKLIAREYQIPVLVLAQFNRAPAIERREPQLHDLRESGSIEQDSDKVLFLHAKEPGPGSSFDSPIDVNLIVAKQRNGQQRKWVELRFFDRLCRFEEREKDAAACS